MGHVAQTGSEDMGSGTSTFKLGLVACHEGVEADESKAQGHPWLYNARSN